MLVNALDILWKLFYKLLYFSIPRERLNTVERNYLTSFNIKSRETIAKSQNFKLKHNNVLHVAMSKAFEEKELFILKDAIIDTKTGHVFIENNSTLHFVEFSSEWPKEVIKRELSLPKKTRLEKVEKVSVGLPNINYFHLTTHWLANIITLSKYNSPLLISPHSHKFSEQICEFYSLQNKVVQSRWIRAEELSMINLGPIGYLHEVDRKILHSFMHSDKPKNKKIYVSRINSSRSLPGERELEIELAAREFIILHAEELSYSEQVSIFSEAKIVVGPHGAGMVNAIYSGEDAHIVEVMPESRFNRCIEWQSAICKQKYNSIFYSTNDAKSQLSQRILTFLDSHV